MSNYDLIMFDMDGTLLPMEVRDFLRPYYDLLAAASVREGYDPQAFRSAVNAGIMGMYDHPSTETNAVAFWRVFFDKVFDGVPPAPEQQQRLVDFMEQFYAVDFGRAGESAVPNPAAAYVTQTLADKGYPLYLATMPMFPYVAVDWRMKWAGCNIGLFDRVTTYENSTAVKPDLSYYRENLQLADVDPSRVLMVGNNTLDDMAAAQLGVDVYLVTDYLINENDFDIESVRHGSLEDLAAWVDTFEPCTSTHALDWRSRADALRRGQG